MIDVNAEIGKKYNTLTAIEYVPHPSKKRRYYLFRCDCGRVKRMDLWTAKRNKSCGCLPRKRHAPRVNIKARHGHARDSGVSRTYRSWCQMKGRCSNSDLSCFKYYGGRGIAVCERWLKFENFLEDMGERPAGHTIDRFPDKNGNYEPGNCRWATRKEQQNNTRQNVNVSMNGKTQTVTQWCEELGLKSNTIICRMRRGWDAQRALSEPILEWAR